MPLVPGDPDWYRCRCGYEMAAGAHEEYARLTAALDADPERFFTDVAFRLSELRTLEPVWT
ncbi:hypothetical protein [Streptomyces sp. SP18CS02]|uniref:hypothetical protein n=1 Tax=Streptomyces sp. SP18CS02 TaxID=3002531 RepID=UPI002E75CD45|nr:hypothetical protein [Streptomyces sp. SP18CS02]MEE1753298.1 hypothetical protein [Streptomyces sp. SP18CS02]